jgi:hypothetical protein
MAAVTTAAISAYVALAVLASVGDQVVTLAVAIIGAAASIAAAFISRGARREARGRRVVVTKAEKAITIADEEIEELADGE